MTTIYLIRHAEAEGNLYRLAHGQYNSTLTPRGYRQLSVLRRRFQDRPEFKTGIGSAGGELFPVAQNVARE